jgi:SAM-dependent methyltransferase
LAELDTRTQHAICDYEGTSYRADFWEGHGREYEDLAERIAIRKLLPGNGHRIADIGAGFGRLADLYSGYDQVVLLDYAKSGLREAQQRLGRSSRFVYVAADIYRLPLAAATCDTVVSVRVLHHLNDVPAALGAVSAALRPGGRYLVEYANKRNLKAVLRFALRRQRWSPFSDEPYQFRELHFDFHPRWMERELSRAGLHPETSLAVSHFRQDLLKRLVPAGRLAFMDGRLQRIGAMWKLSPSIFMRCRTAGEGPLRREALFACPACRSEALSETADTVTCRSCQAAWAIDDGIYDFKAPRFAAGESHAGSVGSVPSGTQTTVSGAGPRYNN